MNRLLAAPIAALLALAASCSDRHWAPPAPPPPPPPVYPQPLSYATPMALATVGGRAKLYVPRGQPGAAGPLAVVDLLAAGRGTRGAGALLGTVPIPGGAYATVISGDERVLVAASADFPAAWIIDPGTDAVTKEIPLTGMGFSSFGGQDAYVTAVIVDPDRNRAWLAVWNGFAALDLARGERVPAEDVLTAPSESPGYDPVSGLIFAPFYDCALAHGPAGATPPPCGTFTSPGPVPMEAGLNVIRLSDRTVFTLQRPGPAATAPVGVRPDALAFDPSAHLAIVAEEGSRSTLVLDFAGASYAAGVVQLDAGAAVRALPGAVYSCTAVHPPSGTVLLAAEFSQEVALSTSAELRAGRPPVALEMPLLPIFPAGVPWVTAGDPHPAAIFEVGGVRHGVLLDSTYRWVARLDLGKLEAVSPANPTALSAAEVAPAVTYLDLTSAP